MIRVLTRGWRADLAGVARAARRSLLVAAPYIKDDEAAWLCGQLRPGVAVLTLANLDTDAVSSAALDVAALGRLAEASPASRLVALPSLHAKVYIADETAAIVTSGNLTRAALDRNIECGVLLDEPDPVRALRAEMQSFTHLGSELDAEALRDLAPIEAELRRTRAGADAAGSPEARREFARVLREARPEFVAAPIGDRSVPAMFRDAVRFVLARSGPLAQRDINEAVRALLPDLCRDDEQLIIKGEPYNSSAWKRRVRHAGQSLKARGEAWYDPATRLWGLAGD